MVGRTLEGRYTILARLGSGSMGTVYRARQHAMGREIAIKILRGDRALDDTAKARFLREARANSLLASPNTVTVFDFGESETGELYLAMELLDGESLGQRLARVGRMTAPVAVDTARQALRSLSEAHAKGIIHRDLKPDNLFFARVLTGTGSSQTATSHEEIVKVLDFGIAKLVRDDSSQPMGVVETQAGTVFGTPRYMSPEQAQGKPLDARSDLYALGVILYQMLTGRPPFTDNDAVVVMARHIKSIPKRMHEACPEASVPKELEDVVMRALSKNPDDRQGSADVLAGELLAALEAQSASSSGVRASITNAAGIRMPESMRPPPVPLPPPRARQRTVGGIPVALLLAAMGLIVLVAATGVYLGLRSGRAPDAPAELSVTPTATSATPAKAPATATVDTPTVTPDALPMAEPVPTAPPKAAPPKATSRGATKPAGTTTSAPASTATSKYGVFDN
jgi:serine/threonine-protein kinase